MLSVLNGNTDLVLQPCTTHEGGHMKKQVATFVGMLSLVLMAGSAFAQTLYVRSNIPFDFVVNKTTLPAGEYAVRPLSDGGDKVWQLRGPDSHSNALMLSNRIESSQASAETKLIFDRIGDHYFLRQIWVEGETSGLELPKTKFENEVANNYTPDKVVVLAKLK
jgi:hypothetical protein